MTLPNFIVIGSPKSGTTSLCAALEQHPDIYFLPRKEANFFNRHFDLGLDWYRALFAQAGTEKAIGEGTPAYAMGRETTQIAARIHDTLPDVRLIYMVRHPIRRITSHYGQDIANGTDKTSLSQAVLTRPHLVETSQYHARLSAYLDHFDRSQIHVIFFEDYVSDYDRVLAECLAFLDVASDVAIPQQAAATRENLSKQRWLVRKLTKLPLYARLRTFVPEGVFSSLRGVMRKKVDLSELDMSWSDEALVHAQKQLAKDTPAFLKSMDRSPDFWG